MRSNLLERLEEIVGQHGVCGIQLREWLVERNVMPKEGAKPIEDLFDIVADLIAAQHSPRISYETFWCGNLMAVHIWDENGVDRVAVLDTMWRRWIAWFID